MTGTAEVAAFPTGAPRPLAARTRLLLEGPIAPTLLRLAAPNVVVMVVQAIVNAGEAYFLGWLGTDALAGASLATRTSSPVLSAPTRGRCSHSC